jgi:hypothetical protein
MTVSTGSPRNADLIDEVAEAVRVSGIDHDVIAARAGLTLQSFRSKLYGNRPWKLADLAGVASAIGVPAGPWLYMVRLGDLGVR